MHLIGIRTILTTETDLQAKAPELTGIEGKDLPTQ